MPEHLYIGSTPYEEDCANVGAPDYRLRARTELNEYIRDLRDAYGPEPDGAALLIQWNAHDFGTYGEVICQWNPDNKAATRYAFKVEAGTARWTQRAADALAAKGYAPHDYRPQPNDEQRRLWQQINDGHTVRPCHPTYGDPEWTRDAVVIVDARPMWGGQDAPVRDEVNAVAVHRELNNYHAEIDYLADPYVITTPQHTIVGPLAKAETLQVIADIIDTLDAYGIMDEAEYDELSWRRWADAMDDYGHRDIIREIARRADVDDDDDVRIEDDTVAAYAEAYARHHGTLDYDDATPNVHDPMVRAVVDRIMRDADEDGFSAEDVAHGRWTTAVPVQW